MPIIKNAALVRGEALSDDLPMLRDLDGALPAGFVIDGDDLVQSDALMTRLHAGDLGATTLIVVVFASPADGRGFSLARLIRRDLGYAHDLRARGHIIPDQYAFAIACGFSSVEISAQQFARQPLEHWRTALHGIKRDYRSDVLQRPRP